MCLLLSFSFHSSNSSSTTSLASNSPKMGASDWAVPQASRLKYRQQFNTLDKLMSGYLSGWFHSHLHTHTHVYIHRLQPSSSQDHLTAHECLCQSLREHTLDQFHFFYTHMIALNPTWQNLANTQTLSLRWEFTLLLFLLFIQQDLKLEMHWWHQIWHRHS